MKLPNVTNPIPNKAVETEVKRGKEKERKGIMTMLRLGIGTRARMTRRSSPGRVDIVTKPKISDRTHCVNPALKNTKRTMLLEL
jgi:hypothetical protein